MNCHELTVIVLAVICFFALIVTVKCSKGGDGIILYVDTIGSDCRCNVDKFGSYCGHDKGISGCGAHTVVSCHGYGQYVGFKVINCEDSGYLCYTNHSPDPKKPKTAECVSHERFEEIIKEEQEAYERYLNETRKAGQPYYANDNAQVSGNGPSQTANAAHNRYPSSFGNAQSAYSPPNAGSYNQNGNLVNLIRNLPNKHGTPYNSQFANSVYSNENSNNYRNSDPSGYEPKSIYERNYEERNYIKMNPAYYVEFGPRQSFRQYGYNPNAKSDAEPDAKYAYRTTGYRSSSS